MPADRPVVRTPVSLCVMDRDIHGVFGLKKEGCRCFCARRIKAEQKINLERRIHILSLLTLSPSCAEIKLSFQKSLSAFLSFAPSPTRPVTIETCIKG